MSSSTSGKGDKWRKDFSFSKYWTNYDDIKSSSKSSASEIKKRGGKTTYIYKKS